MRAFRPSGGQASLDLNRRAPVEKLCHGFRSGTRRGIRSSGALIMSVHRHNSADDNRHSVTAVFGFHQDSDPQALHAPVLVLNASYEPINICAARRAIVLVLKGVAMTEEENGHF